jgi:hypothetical protein
MHVPAAIATGVGVGVGSEQPTQSESIGAVLPVIDDPTMVKFDVPA